MKDSSISIVSSTVSNLEADNSLFEKFTFESVITKLEKPIGKGCPVYIMNKTTGQIIHKTETDETSSVYVPNLRKYIKYLVIATDVLDIYNSTVFDLNWDITKDFGYNYSLAYYDISKLDNIQSILDFNRPSDNLRPNIDTVSFISLPFVQDDVGLLEWVSSGAIRRSNVGKIPSYNYDGVSYLTQDRGFFYQNLPFTIEAYVNVSSKSTLNQYIFNQTVSTTAEVALYLDANLNLIFNRQKIFGNIPVISLSSLSPLSLNTNYHVAICFDGSAFFLYLNGILQTTITDVDGIPYIEYPFRVGTNFKGDIGGVEITQACKYTTNFNVVLLPFSYSSKVYSDPSDTLANYVVLQIKNNKNTLQPFIQDVAKNLRFKPNISESKKDYFISSGFNTTLNNYGILPLGTRDFCIELKCKVLSQTNTTSSSVLISNDKTITSWAANSWFFAFNTTTTPNKYSFRTYAGATWASTYPAILKEVVDIAIVRDGTKLRFYINGFLDVEHIIAATLNLDAKTLSSLAFGNNLTVNIYDIKVTMDTPRYTSEYTPKIADIMDKDIREQQYLVANFPFKSGTTDFNSALSFVNTSLSLSRNESINGTYSAYFSGTTKSISTIFYVPKETFTVECFLKPIVKATQSTLYSLYDSTKEYFSLAIRNNLLSYFNGTAWIDTTYTVDYEIFNHIVIQRIKNTIKILAHGNLVASVVIPTLPIGYLSLAIGCSKASDNYLTGYINNLYIYKNYSKFEDTYIVPKEDVIPVDPNVDPVVVVNSYTTSALDFEQGLIDQIPTTLWTKEGTAEVQSVNKIYGGSSFETKVLGDSLYTNRPILTGGSTPFTIEFYALIKGRDLTSTRNQANYLFTKHDNKSGGDQSLAISKEGDFVFTYFNGSWINSTSTGTKIKYNEINKYCLSYDGSALRGFVNNELNFVLGKSVGINTNVSEPYRFLRSYIPSFSGNSNTTYGLLDNINIFDGIATKVRDKDLFEDFLVTDLSFDGENNSTKIVDNGTLKANWVVKGDCKISTDQKFNGFSSFNFPPTSSYANLTSTNLPLLISSDEDFTISFKFKRVVAPSTIAYETLITTGTTSYITSASVWSINVFSSNYLDNPMLVNKISFINEKKYSKPSDGLISNTVLTNNVEYNVSIVRVSGETSLYINNKLDVSTTVFNQTQIDFTNLTLGAPLWSASNNNVGFKGFIKDLKVYKGMAVVPEDITGRIQLDFDDNVLDKYNNSTWINNGVTFDQVNSIKGSAVKFDSTKASYLSSGLCPSLEYGNSDFLVSLDAKKVSNTSALDLLVASGETTIDTNKVNALGIHWQSNASNILFAYAYKNKDYIISYPDNKLDTFYNIAAGRINNVLFLRINGVLVAADNYNLSLPLSFNTNSNTLLGRCNWRGGATNSYFNGYIDNFKSDKNYPVESVVNRPAVHFPLENTITNIGFANLTTSNPALVPSAVNDKKCMFFNGNYINIASNNIFNLGTNSDFHMEIDFCWTEKLAANNNPYLILNATTTNYVRLYINGETSSLGFGMQGVANIEVSTVLQFNKFYHCKVSRQGKLLKLKLYDIDGTLLSEVSDQNYTTSLDFSVSGTNIGGGSHFSNIGFKGYLANFKMFVGTSEVPKTYNDKKVLDVDFKPTRQSYLFKDNNNKCVIHPVNITQRDYQNSQYCLKLNGTNQYLDLGRNDSLNFGLDDFIIQFIIQLDDNASTTKDLMLLSNTIAWTTGYQGLSCYQNSVTFGEYGKTGIATKTKLKSGINKIIVMRSGNNLSIIINDDVPEVFPFTTEINFNKNNQTRIGLAWDNSDTFFNGTIYSIKILRNTTDLISLI